MVAVVAYLILRCHMQTQKRCLCCYFGFSVSAALQQRGLDAVGLVIFAFFFFPGDFALVYQEGT